jgi:hypothetical protein
MIGMDMRIHHEFDAHSGFFGRAQIGRQVPRRIDDGSAGLPPQPKRYEIPTGS